MNPADFPPSWLLTYFVIGWGLGLLAVRDWKWAALCGLTTTLAVVFVLHGQTPPVFRLGPLWGAGAAGAVGRFAPASPCCPGGPRGGSDATGDMGGAQRWLSALYERRPNLLKAALLRETRAQ